MSKTCDFLMAPATELSSRAFREVRRLILTENSKGYVGIMNQPQRCSTTKPRDSNERTRRFLHAVKCDTSQ
eukprot:1966706-Pleurochrysis_carterae.AAC.1